MNSISTLKPSGPSGRLESLDILRGLDLFILVFFQPVFMRLAMATGGDNVLKKIFGTLFTHVEWEGFHLWDQVMPLFMFMAGVSIPFAFSKFKKGEVSASRMFRRILKRVVLLWIFGAIVQGNLLNLDPSSLYLYTDTLQAIAMGYLFASLFYMYLPLKGLIAITLILPCIYTAGMLLTGGYGPGVNLAEVIDRRILGRFLYGATVSDGVVTFADWYHIGWIYSTLNFVTTVMTGLLTGYLLKAETVTVRKKMILMLAVGAGLLVASYLLSFWEPVIKRLWTSSMCFLSSGISILLMALSYYVIDVRKWRKGLSWLKIYGMNSILAYMLFNTLDVNSLFHFWFHGLEQYIHGFYPFVLMAAKCTTILLILWYFNKKAIYLKV